VTAFAKEILQKIGAGKLEASPFTTEAWEQISPNLAQGREFLDSVGTLNAIELLERTEQDGNRLHRYRLIFNDANLFYSVTLTKDGKIAALRFQRE
jgi:hypothetical protein